MDRVAVFDSHRFAPSGLSPLRDEPGHDHVLDTIAGNIAELLECDTAIVRLREATGGWRNGHFGSTGRGRLLEHSLAMMCDTPTGPLIECDAGNNAKLIEHPLVNNSPKICSIAGIGIYEQDDLAGGERLIGIICAMSSSKIEFTPGTAKMLESTALMLSSLHEQQMRAEKLQRENALLERSAANTKRLERQFRQAERMASIGSWRMTLDDRQATLSDGIYAIHELPLGGKVPLEKAIEFYAPEYREIVKSAIERAIRTGEGWDIEADFIGAKGTRKRVRALGEVELENGRPIALVGVFHDISERYALEQELQHRAHSDELTGLANRAGLNEMLAERMLATRNGDAPLGVVVIDLDNFKAINDTAGHSAGDEVLCRAASILESPWLEPCFPARIGGDELVLLFDDSQQIDDLPALLTRLTKELAEPMEYNGITLAPSASMGASFMHLGSNGDPYDLLEAADNALYEAKKQGKGGYHITQPASTGDLGNDGMEDEIGRRAAG